MMKMKIDKNEKIRLFYAGLNGKIYVGVISDKCGGWNPKTVRENELGNDKNITTEYVIGSACYREAHHKLMLVLAGCDSLWGGMEKA